MEFVKAAIAVWVACSGWNVQPPERCVNELWDCTEEVTAQGEPAKTVQECKDEVLDRHEPRNSD